MLDDELGKAWKIGLLLGMLVLGALISEGCGKKLKGIGESCLFTSDCKVGLQCVDQICALGRGENQYCTSDLECDTLNLKCIQGRCQFSGKACEKDSQCPPDQKCSKGMCLYPAGEDGPCLDNKGCKEPLVCSRSGKCASKGAAGTAGTGEKCTGDSDCQRGLICSPNAKVCAEGGAKGMPCQSSKDCKKEFVCNNKGVCAKRGEPGTADLGQNCQKSEDCQKGLICGSGGKCRTAGVAPKGSVCTGPEICAPGLICATKGPEEMIGICRKKGEPGTKEVGEECKTSDECQFTAICGWDNKCVFFRPYEGVKCEEPSKYSDPFRAFFEIPRKGKPLSEYFRLPFPNDIRKDSRGFLKLGNYPRPPEILGEDLIGKYIDRIEKELKGFSLNGTAVFRFSQPIDFDRLELRGSKPSIVYVNLDNDQKLGLSISYYEGRSKYVCHHQLYVRPYGLMPLKPNTTYAVVLTANIYNKSGEKLNPDVDFQKLMADSPPSEPELAAAHKAYEKLRNWLKKNASRNEWPTPQDVVAAAVFTTQDPIKFFSKFRSAAESQPQPKIKDLTLCKPGVKSPCEGDGSDPSRKCGDSSGPYYELHGKLTLPIFQKGESPYWKEGGEIEFESEGTPKVVGFTDVCISITVPKGDPPPDGWPLIIYSHGTGGNFRSQIVNKTAERAAQIKTDTGKTVKYATIGIDQVVHGLRRGSSKIHPNFLYFNFRNPQAALGNVLQNAADQFTLVRWAKSFKMDAQDSPTGKAILFDGGKFVFFGHSQGGFSGPIFLGFEPDVKAAVLSGAGGLLIESLLKKTSPVNVAGIVKFLAGETKMTRTHPLLNLFQIYFDRVDPVNYGHRLFWEFDPNVGAKHVLQTYGLGDTYTPPRSIEALAFSMNIHQLSPFLKRLDGLVSVSSPARGNFLGKQRVTAVLVQYKPDNYDGHFVIFRHPDGIQHLQQFLGTLVTDPKGIPTVGKKP